MLIDIYLILSLVGKTISVHGSQGAEPQWSSRVPQWCPIAPKWSQPAQLARRDSLHETLFTRQLAAWRALMESTNVSMIPRWPRSAPECSALSQDIRLLLQEVTASSLTVYYNSCILQQLFITTAV